MRCSRAGLVLIAGTLALALWNPTAAPAQIVIGDSLSVNMGGTLGFGYGASYGAPVPSNHTSTLYGNAVLSGFYYHPNFLTFNVQPYYNRSETTSASQTIFDGSGTTATVSLFGGSRMPGTISWGFQNNSTGQYGIADMPGLTTHGSGRSFAITWSVLMPSYPTLTASYSTSSNSSVILGTEQETDSATRTFNLSSGYRLLGFDLNAFLTRQSMDVGVPSFLGSPIADSESGSTTYGLMASHRLPMSGSMGVSWSRSHFGHGSDDSRDNVNDSLTGMASINPTRKLSLSADVRYVSNLYDVLRQQFMDGGPAVLVLDDSAARSLVLGTAATYSLGRGVALRGYVSHRRQNHEDRDFSDTSYGGTVNMSYSRPLFGMLYLSAGMVDTVNQDGHSNLSFTGSASVTRRFGGWETSADLSYGQNLQTLLTNYTTSSFNYGAFLRRRLNWKTYWHSSARSSRSVLTQRDGEGNSSYTVTTGMTWGRYTVNGAYSASQGRSLLTAFGVLQPAPEAGLITDDLVLFNARSYSFSLAATPLRKMTLSASYAHALSDTSRNSLLSQNDTHRFHSRLEYRLRQLSLLASFTRDRQAISATGAPPSVVNSYRIGVSRWFDFF